MRTKALSVESRIHELRGQRVMLSSDLAELYGVTPGALVQAVKRNIGRFPGDFMFQVTLRELANLKSQFVISSWGGARRATPYAFTESGVAMLSSVLRSRKAVAVNVEIIRAFVRLRRAAVSFAELARKLDALERRYNERFRVVFEALRALMRPEPPPRKAIGFTAPADPAGPGGRGRRAAAGQVRRAARRGRFPAQSNGT